MARVAWLVDRPESQTPYVETHKLEDVLKELKRKGQTHLYWSDGEGEPVLYDVGTGEAAKGGPGSGWFAPPKGTHVGKEPRGKRREGKTPKGKDTTTIKADDFLIAGLPIERDDPRWGLNHPNASAKARKQAKDEIVTELSKRTGISEEEVNKFVKQWAHSSNNDDMRSLAIQRDATKEFGVKTSKFTQERVDAIETRRKDFESLQSRVLHMRKPGTTVEDVTARMHPEFLPLLESDQQRTLLRAMYDNTQGQLAKAGFKPGDTIRLRRGVGLSESIAKDWKKGDNKSIIGNALESWSIDSETANQFARTAKKGQMGVTLEMDIPIESVIGTARTGFGCLTEGEFITLGAEGEAKVIYVKP